MKKHLSHLVILSAVGIASLASPAISAEASYETGIQETTQKLQKLEKEQNAVEAQLSGLSEKIAQTEEESRVLVDEIEDTAKELDTLKAEIDALNKAIEAREAKLQQQARAVQVGGDASKLVHFILKADSLADVMGRVDAVSQIVGANKELVQQQREDIALVAAKEKETEAKQESQMKLAAELESKKAEFEEQQAEKEVLVASIAAEKADVQKERTQYLAQKSAAEQRVRELQEARTVASQAASRPASDSSNGGRSENKKTTVQETAAPAPSVSGGSVISNAYSVMGTRYSYGGTSTSGFDCSGFTAFAFNKAGKSIPRTAGSQYAASSKIPMSQAKPGDLVFFNQTGKIDHVAIYLGNGQFIGAQTSTGVAVASFNSGYWARYVAGFGRVN